MVLWANGIHESLPAHAAPPADLTPVRAGGPEFLRLRALAAIAAHDAERGDACVAEGEDDVSGRDLTHELVEGIAVAVLVALGRPEIAALDLLAEGLVLVDPPISHSTWSLRSRPARPKTRGRPARLTPPSHASSACFRLG